MKTNSKRNVFCKVLGVACMVTLFSCFIGLTAYATENDKTAAQPAVVSSRTADDGVYIYIKGVGDIASGTTVQVGNVLCEKIQVANIASMGIPVKTTILFDNSMSLSKRWGSQAKELIASLIDSHVEGEEFRIATFADGLNVLADFSTEYDVLKTMVEEIEFLDQDSYLTDILYELLKQSSDSGEANYMRYIIITDGADDKDIKYTQTELSDLMKTSGVVIHTVGVKASNNNTLLENLFSYARFSGGTYSTAESNTEIESLKNLIDADYSLLCLRLVPEADIMDGSRKEAKLSLNSSAGEIVLTTSLKMPFGDVQSAQSSTAEQSVEPSASATVEPEKQELPSIAVQSDQKDKEDTKETKKINIVPIIVIVVAFLAGVVVLVLLLVMNKGKRKQINVVIAGSEQSESGVQENGAQTSPVPPDVTVQSGGNTTRLGGQINTAGNTMRLQGGMGQPVPRQSFITITDINNPQRNFRVPINTRIVIGRETGDIVLGFDAAVSHTHCEIVKKGNLFYVNDLKSSNGTFYGNMRVYNETPIMSGGILEVGTCKYKITIEN